MPVEEVDAIRAVGLAQRAVRAYRQSSVGYLNILAAAYGTAGRFSESAATAQKAIELARAAGYLKWVGEIEARSELYRSGCAYHEFVGMTSLHNP